LIASPLFAAGQITEDYDMKQVSLTALTAASLLFAGSAHAQVAGGLTGQVGGAARVGTPQVPDVTGQAGSIARDGSRMTRDTVRDARGLAESARPDLDARTDADVDAAAGQDGAAIDASLRTGLAVRSADGISLGSVVDVARDATGRVTAFTVRSAEGLVRTLPADGAAVDGDVLVTGQTAAEIDTDRPD